MLCDNPCDKSYFNPRAPCGARPPKTVMPSRMLADFNPRAPCGARPEPRCPWLGSAYFNPRAPCGARPRTCMGHTGGSLFQSTRPVRGATAKQHSAVNDLAISIHAPRAGRDQQGRYDSVFHAISIHAPRAGRDSAAIPHGRRSINFNPRAPCGARQRSSHRRCRDTYFNPRAPCGARLVDIYGEDAQGTFQSTRPVRGATEVKELFSGTAQFQSTRPVRGATAVFVLFITLHLFQSTRPVRGATRAALYIRVSTEISIHAPRAGRDSTTALNSGGDDYFNPRAPCGARQ